MLACLFAMLMTFSNGPVQLEEGLEGLEAPSFEVPAVDGPLRNQLPIFGPDDPTPEFRLHREASDEPIIKASFTEAELGSESRLSDKDKVTPEASSDASEATTAVLASQEADSSSKSGAFFVSSWPYFLIGLALVGWVANRLRLKRVPSFEHHVIPERSQNETEQQPLRGHFKASKRFQNSENSEESAPVERAAESDKVVAVTDFAEVESPFSQGSLETTTESTSESEESPQLTGQFKVATRFQKPKSVEEEGANENASSINDAMKTLKTAVNGDNAAERPADDEFEVGFDESDSDSGVLSEEQRAKILEAAEIIASVKKAKNPEGDSRFK